MKTETKVSLLTDNHDVEIARVFYAEKIKGKKVEWGVYAENFDSDSPALVAVVSGQLASRNAKRIATALEKALMGQKVQGAA